MCSSAIRCAAHTMPSLPRMTRNTTMPRATAFVHKPLGQKHSINITSFSTASAKANCSGTWCKNNFGDNPAAAKSSSSVGGGRDDNDVSALLPEGRGGDSRSIFGINQRNTCDRSRGLTNVQNCSNRNGHKRSGWYVMIHSTSGRSGGKTRTRPSRRRWWTMTDEEPIPQRSYNG